MTDWVGQVTAPEFTRALGRLVTTRRFRTRGTVAGPRGALPRDSGLDWAGHRAYQPGDDLRYLDWHLYARWGKPFVRHFLAERAERVDLLIDASRSMSLGHPAKLDVARAVAFSLGYLALASGERVGAMAFADRPLAALTAGRGQRQLSRLLRFLTDLPTGPTTDMARSLYAFAGGAREIGEVVLISDLLDAGMARGLAALRQRGFRVRLLRVRAADDESARHVGDAAVLLDVETRERMRVVLSPADRRRYEERRRSEASGAERACASAGVPLANLGVWRSLNDLVFHDLRAAGLLD